jgi:hypothetical protein
MPYITCGSVSDLQIVVPTKNTQDWSETMRVSTFLKISSHDHTGVSGNGRQLSGNSILAGSITNTTILLANDGYLLGRNVANSANINIIKVNTGDTLTLGTSLLSPTLVTPVLGVATATSINKLSLTAPATSATLTIADGSSLITSGAFNATLASTASVTTTLPGTSQTLVGLTSTDTLTNKTLTAPTISTITNGGTLTLPSGTLTIADTTKSVQNAAFTAKGDILIGTGAGAKSALAVGGNNLVLTADSTQTTGVKWASAGTGSVTSVTFTGDGTVLSSTPSAAITSSGTVTAALNTQTANTYLCGPTSGAAAAPTFKVFRPPTLQKFLSTGTTTGYVFTISTSSTVAIGDTYTNNAVTYTVLAALSAQTGAVFFASGASAPLASGTLTRATGAGTSSITFTANQALATYTLPIGCLYIKVRMVGGGGGGAGGGSTDGGGTTGGGNSYFGALLMSANGGSAGAWGGNPGLGGAASLGTGPIGFAIRGGMSSGVAGVGTSTALTAPCGSGGGVSPFGGAGAGGTITLIGAAAQANSGSGGGGGSGDLGTNVYGGTGGSAGGYVDAIITAPSSTYVYGIGVGGTGGSSPASGHNGAAGGTGFLIIEEFYQ